VGAQAWGLSKKLREADACITAEWQQTIYEVHPEVSFWAMKGKTPMLHSQKTAEGAQERVDSLVHQGGFPTEFVDKLPAGIPAAARDCLSFGSWGRMVYALVTSVWAFCSWRPWRTTFERLIQI
jgi:predicted RNase H-like nuclease